MSGITIFVSMNDVISVDISVDDWEKNVVRLIADGYSVPEISSMVKLHKRNVEYKLGKLKTRLQCATLAELVAFFLRHKLIE